MVKSVTPDRTNWMPVANPDSPAPTMTTDGVARPWRRASVTARCRRRRPMSSARCPPEPLPEEVESRVWLLLFIPVVATPHGDKDHDQQDGDPGDDDDAHYSLPFPTALADWDRG